MKYVLVVMLVFFLWGMSPAYASCSANIGGIGVSNAAPEIRESLNAIDKKFCEVQTAENRRPLHFRVTQIERSVSTQAGFIYKCLSDDKKCSHYANQEAISELKKVFDEAKVKTNANQTSITSAIEAKISEQITRKCFVSKHLSSRGVDVGTTDLSNPSSDKLMELIAEQRYKVGSITYGIEIVDERDTTAPHFHLNFEPFGFDPRKCPKE